MPLQTTLSVEQKAQRKHGLFFLWVRENREHVKKYITSYATAQKYNEHTKDCAICTEGLELVKELVRYATIGISKNDRGHKTLVEKKEKTLAKRAGA